MTAAFVTSLYIDDNTSKFDSRTFGFFVNMEDAVETVRRNIGNLEECLYDYVVIGEGIHAEVKSEKWFKWDEEKGWTDCDKPSELVGIVNFALS